MDKRLSATDLARRLGDILGRIRYRGESFLIERNGTPVARLIPTAQRAPGTLNDALAAWWSASPADPSFGDDLAGVRASDQPPSAAWDS
jgi:antitoxin (DNA-binding transcriptional repressor) of toxin-antitoxin stability system